MFLDWPNYSSRACGRAPVYKLLLIFPDVALPNLNDILMGSSGLELTPSDAYGSQSMVKNTTLYSWPSLTD